jgi:hypothetical protein
LVWVQVKDCREHVVEVTVDQHKAPLLTDDVERKVNLIKASVKVPLVIHVGDVEEKRASVCVASREEIFGLNFFVFVSSRP